MFETPLTVVGNIVNDPIRRAVGGQELIKFRLASNSRRRGADGTWTAGNSLYITVNCWGRLVTGVGAALAKGSPVIVVGTIHTSEYEDRDGLRRSAVEMRASAVGPDLSRCVARIDKIVYAGPDPHAEPAAGPHTGPTTARRGGAGADPEPPDVDAPDDADPDPLADRGELTEDGEDPCPADQSRIGGNGLTLSV